MCGLFGGRRLTSDGFVSDEAAKIATAATTADGPDFGRPEPDGGGLKTPRFVFKADFRERSRTVTVLFGTVRQGPSHGLAEERARRGRGEGDYKFWVLVAI